MHKTHPKVLIMQINKFSMIQNTVHYFAYRYNFIHFNLYRLMIPVSSMQFLIISQIEYKGNYIISRK